jgi:DNA polymerase-3 subunit beta
MKFTIEKQTLIEILSKIHPITAHRTNLVITETVLIKASTDKNIITFAATDLEIGASLDVSPSEIHESGTACVNARKLYEIVSSMEGDEIHIEEIDSRWVEITDGKSKFNIVGMDPDDYPSIDLLESDDIRIDGAVLKSIINKSLAPSFAPGDPRQHIKGILLAKKESSLQAASTNGNSIIVIDYKIDGLDLENDFKNIIIPKSSLKSIDKFIEPDDILWIGVNGNNLVIRKEAHYFSIRLLEGKFVDFGSIMNTDNSFAILVDRGDFAAMLRRQSILCSEQYNGVVFDFKSTLLEARSTNPDMGESRETLEIDNQSGGHEGIDAIEFAVSFNPKLLLELLPLFASTKNEKIELIFQQQNPSQRPCIIRGDGFVCAVMPMMI